MMANSLVIGQKVAEYLSRNEKVAWVNYCGLPDNKYYELAQKYMPNGSCGVRSEEHTSELQSH